MEQPKLKEQKSHTIIRRKIQWPLRDNGKDHIVERELPVIEVPNPSSLFAGKLLDLPVLLDEGNPKNLQLINAIQENIPETSFELLKSHFQQLKKMSDATALTAFHAKLIGKYL